MVMRQLLVVLQLTVNQFLKGKQCSFNSSHHPHFVPVSSKWLGHLPFTEKLGGSSPLTGTTFASNA